ncbi:MAG: hypothetical protein FWD49_05235 [Firmicutes bacterium]|nr:hypothetical protein [Bacillota bacterium]
MRKKDKKEKLVPVTIKNHRDKKGGHPHVVLGDIDNRHISAGLTTKPKKGKNTPNYALENDPIGNLKESERAYMRRQATVAPKVEYDSPRKGAMTSKDHAQAKVYGERAKQKYLNEKEKK